MSGRTGRHAVKDEEQLAHERRLIAHARERIAEYEADPRRGEAGRAAVQIGRLDFYVTELAAALELRHAGGQFVDGK